MYFFQLYILIFLILKCIILAGFRRVCEYQSWAQYRPAPATFYPEHINASLCSHLLFKYAVLNGTNISATDYNHDINTDGSLYARFVATKQRNPDLKVLLSVGGFMAGDKALLSLVRNTSRVAAFARNAKNFLVSRNFDGLNLNFYHESIAKLEDSLRSRFSYLIESLYNELNKQGLLLCLTLPATSLESIQRLYNVSVISRLADFVTIDTMDFNGEWSSKVGHNSPLYPSKLPLQNNLNSNDSIYNWIKAGIQPSKINIGLAFYGRGFILQDPKSYQPGSSFIKASSPQPITGASGFAAYFEICPLFSNRLVCIDFLMDQMVPYLVDGSNWIGFDDKTSIANKVLYAMRNKLGGAAVNSIDLDDFPDLCGGGKYPLLNILNDKLYTSNATTISRVSFHTTSSECSSIQSKNACITFFCLNQNYIIIGCAAGGGVLLIFFIALVVCLVRRRNMNKEGVEDNHSMTYESATANLYANGKREINNSDEEVYSQIRDSQVNQMGGHEYLKLVRQI